MNIENISKSNSGLVDYIYDNDNNDNDGEEKFVLIMENVKDIADNGDRCIILQLDENLYAIGDKWKSKKDLIFIDKNIKSIGGAIARPDFRNATYRDILNEIFLFFYINQKNELYKINEKLKPIYIDKDVKSARVNQYEHNKYPASENVRRLDYAIIYYNKYNGELYKHEPKFDIKTLNITYANTIIYSKNVFIFDVSLTHIFYIDENGNLYINSTKMVLPIPNMKNLSLKYIGNDNILLIDDKNILYLVNEDSELTQYHKDVLYAISPDIVIFCEY